jgi:hypothetical protein
MDELFSLCMLFIEHNLLFYQRSTLSLIDVAVILMRNANVKRDPVVLLFTGLRACAWIFLLRCEAQCMQFLSILFPLSPK